MPSFADWSRADIIAALALTVSIFAFAAAAVSAFLSWRSYVAAQSARRPRMRVYFEPFVDSDVWWIAHFRIANPSDHVLRFQTVKITTPFVVFSTWLGSWTGGGTGGGPMHNDLPTEVTDQPTCKTLSKIDDRDDMDFEIQPSRGGQALAELIIRRPRLRLSRHIHFQVNLLELSAIPKRLSFHVAAPFPTKKNTKPRD